jgi:citrate synthase
MGFIHGLSSKSAKTASRFQHPYVGDRHRPGMSDDLNQGLEGITVAETRLRDVDGEAGELVVAGYPVDELARNGTYEESVFRLLHDRLPDADELAEFRADLATRRDIGEEVHAVLERAAAEEKPAMDALRMGVAVATLGTDDGDPETDARRAIAVFPTVVAAYWRYRQGAEPVEPARTCATPRITSACSAARNPTPPRSAASKRTSTP